MSKIKCFPHYQHEIELFDSRPAYRRQFKLKPEDAEEAHRQIVEMEANGIVAESFDNQFNSPIFLITKRNGSKRFIVDLRLLNSRIKPKLIQLPKIDDLLQEVTSTKFKYVTTIDFTSRYLQLNVHEDSKKFLSFTDPLTGRHMAFQRVPFGLSTSLYALQSVLQLIFGSGQGAKIKNLGIYMDDVVTTHVTFAEHLQYLRELFNILSKNNLSANPTKCEIACESIDYLGFHISGKGISLSQSKVEVIKKLVPPTNYKALQRWL